MRDVFVKNFGWVLPVHFAYGVTSALKASGYASEWVELNLGPSNIEFIEKNFRLVISKFNSLKVGDVVLVENGNNIYLMILAFVDENKVRIYDKKGKVGWWVNKKDIVGQIVSVEEVRNIRK